MHAGTHSLVKMVRICKIIAEKNILEHVAKVTVIACARSSMVVHLNVFVKAD